MSLRIFLLLPLMGCASIEMPPPISFPSVCMGEETCEARKNAETLSSMGYKDAGLVVMCADANIRDVLEEECGSDVLQYP
jgi:hypothetical protein